MATLAGMSRPLSPRWLGLRSAVFAVVAGLLAAMGHAAGGGGFPDAAALLATTAAIGGAVAGLARRRRSAREIFCALLASQLAFHLMFVVAGHEHRSFALGRMVAFHVVAAALAALVMARGEMALFALLSWLDRLLPAAPPPAAPSERSAWAAHPVVGRVPADRAAMRPISRRGPPVPA